MRPPLSCRNALEVSHRFEDPPTVLYGFDVAQGFKRALLDTL